MATGDADVNLGIDIEKKGQGDKEAAAGLELVAHAADSAKDELAQLDRKLLETRAAMVAAGKTFAQTGDISPFKALLKDQRELTTVSKTLTKFSDDAAKASEQAAARMKKAFEQALTDKKGGLFGFLGGNAVSNALIPQMQVGGLQAGTAFAGGFREALISLAAPVGLVVGPPLVAAIGASIAGATLGGLGLAAIAGAVALQFSSPLVHSAATDLGTYVTERLREATRGFALQFAEGLVALRREAEPLWANLQAGLKSLEPYVANLLVRLGEGLAKLGPGLGRALEAAGPVLGAISKNIPTLLNSINIFFDEISKGGKGAAEAIDAILKTVSALIAGLGFAIRGLSNMFDFMAQAGDKVTGILAKIPVVGKPWEELHNYVHGVATSFGETQLSAGGASAAINVAASASAAATAAFRAQQAAAAALADEIDRITNASLGLAGADLQLRQDEAGLVALHKQHGSALQGNTADALANQQAFLGLARDLEGARQAEIQHGATLQEANAHLQANAGKLYDMAAAAGFDRDQVRALIESMLAIPNVNRTITINEVRTHTDIYRTIDQSGNLVGGSPYLRSASQLGLQAFGGIVGAARGLIASKGPTVVFGERSLPEAYIPSRNSGISQGRADMLLGTAASWWGRRLAPAGGGGGRSLTVNVYAGWGANGAEIGQQVAQVISRQIRTDPAFAATIAGAST